MTPRADSLLARSQWLAVRIAELERTRANALALPATPMPVGSWQYRDTPALQLTRLRRELFHDIARDLRLLLAKDPKQLHALAAQEGGLRLLSALLPEELDALALPQSQACGHIPRLQALPSRFPAKGGPAGDILVTDQGRSVVVTEPHAGRIHVHAADGEKKGEFAWATGLPFGLFSSGGQDFYVCDVSGRSLARMALDGTMLDRIDLERAAPPGEHCLTPYFGAMLGGEVVLRTSNPKGDLFRIVRFHPENPAGTWRSLDTTGLRQVNHIQSQDGVLLAGEISTGRIFRHDETQDRFQFCQSTGLGAPLYRFSLCNASLFSLSDNRVTMTNARGELLFASTLARHFALAGDCVQTLRAHENNGQTTLYVAGHSVCIFRLDAMNL